MAIKVSCPSCGAKRTLPDVYQGRNVTCPKCGAGFPATPSASSSGSVEALAALPEDYMVPSGIKLGTAVQSSVLSVKAQAAPILPPLDAVSASDRLTGEHPAFKFDEPKQTPPTPASPPAPAATTAPTASAKREYKVLTRQNLWFAGQFDPKAFEEALNTYAQQGWSLKSTMVLKVPTPEGDREDVFVVLER